MSPRSSGYTLLEMVVVIAILAMATAVVAPPSYRMITSWQEATQVSDALQQIEHLPSLISTSGAPLYAKTGDGIELLTLPKAWHLKLNEPFYILANGFCSSSQGTLVTDHQTIAFKISSPFCKVERTDLL